ncbi:hypothetical protein KOM00_01295 [Geomonas sp. Red69]|uniref:Response regulatory domain-containing protein n=1 Tax=Geomonas diazotrophica TaxID=2843197 RepID=A0ABX8JGR5_9BACT|nr:MULTISPECIES: hypothetical protein [Geomonas]MBU5635365.1 hypothetical protein [Geomonas diazotrophica]QWV97579.1 hypothetical protein KP005_19970 [Geomonas nitrogeniifigens]QXE86720.1 hypothetical protein KP003_20625 [Geomonas nitrogeniifigens]
MTRVLLIADTQRVQRIFHDMSEQGLLQLQTASTLALGEFELSAFSPDITFVQSRISGFSGDILLRHLDKMLPTGGGLVLLAGDSEDAAQAKRHGRVSLDLTMDDALLEQSVAALLAGDPLAAAPPEEPQPARPAPSKGRKAAPATAAAQEEAPQQGAAPTCPEPADLEQPTEEATPAPVVEFQPLPVEPAGAGEYPALRGGGKSDVSAFEEVMQQAEGRNAPMEAALSEVEDRVEVRKGVSGRELLEEATPAPPALDLATKEGGGYYTGETVAEALLRVEQKKRRRPFLFIVPALVLIAIPLVSYLAGRNSAPEQATMPAAKPAVRPAPSPAAPSASAPAAPVHAPGAAPAPSKGVPSAAPPAAKAPATPPVPAVKPPTPPGAKPGGQPQAKSAPRRGVEGLPAMLEGTKLDAEYGKKNPGWVRYLGIRAEYKLFKENNVYRAIQVIPVPGGTISDDLFKRVLRQFGGADSYRVESSAGKGDYLVEQCAAPGGAALTIYRNKTNKKMKALVVYYP